MKRTIDLATRPTVSETKISKRKSLYFTTKLYDRREGELTVDEIERIAMNLAGILKEPLRPP